MSSTPVEPTPSDNQNEVVPKACGDREEPTNERAKRAKTDHDQWFVEQLDAHTKWSLKINGVLHEVTSDSQNAVFVDTIAFGQVLVIDGKLQSAEVDEFVYHENTVHHGLIHHPNPKSVFIMGGGEGSTAREVLKHRSVEKVVMCDIDKEVVEFCKMHMTQNMAAFTDPRLHIVINDAKAQLEAITEKFDVIIGDLADPIVGGPCNGLYTKSFYEDVIKPRLNENGIFVTQAGLAGVLSHKEIFSPIHNTIKQVFGHVIAYTAHIPSYADTCGWVLATDKPIKLDFAEVSRRIQTRMTGEMHYLDAALIVSAHILNKVVYKTLQEETRVITDENLIFAHGHGIAAEHGAADGGAFVEGFVHEPDALVGGAEFAAQLEAFMVGNDEEAALGLEALLEGGGTHDPFVEGTGAHDPGASMQGGTGAPDAFGKHGP